MWKKARVTKAFEAKIGGRFAALAEEDGGQLDAGRELSERRQSKFLGGRGKQINHGRSVDRMC